MVSRKKIMMIGALALSTAALAGKLVQGYLQYRDLKHSYQCLVKGRGKADKCTPAISFKEACTKEAKHYMAKFNCRKTAEKLVKILEEDISFPFIAKSNYYQLADEYARTQLAFSNSLHTDELPAINNSISQMDNFIEKLKETNLTDTALYKTTLEDYQEGLSFLVDRIDRLFQRHDWIYLGAAHPCPEPADRSYNPQKPLANKGLVNHLACVMVRAEKEKKSREKIKQEMIRKCEEGTIHTEGKKWEEACTLRKTALARINKLENKITQFSY